MQEVQIKLSKKERKGLQEFKKAGGHSLRAFNRTTILSFLDKGLSVSEIAGLLEIDRSTIWRVRQRYHQSGLEASLGESPRSGQPKKYTTDYEAELIALACGPAPKGRKRWTIRLLTSQLNKRKGFETITYGSVRSLLKKTI